LLLVGSSIVSILVGVTVLQIFCGSSDGTGDSMEISVGTGQLVVSLFSGKYGAIGLLVVVS